MENLSQTNEKKKHMKKTACRKVLRKMHVSKII